MRDLLYRAGSNASKEIVRIEIPEKHEDECWDEIANAMKARGWWSSGQWDNCRATYLGHLVSRVNMGLVVATL